MKHTRMIIAALAVSASMFVGVAHHEGYTPHAIIPVPGDVPTMGHGTTPHPDGTPVKLGDTTTPQRALNDLLRDINSHSAGIKKCITAPLYQYEFDAYSSLAYNVGVGAVCNSSIPRKLAAGEYEAACKTILDFNGMCIQRNAAGRCTKKKVLRGLEIRRQAEYTLCIGPREEA